MNNLKLITFDIRLPIHKTNKVLKIKKASQMRGFSIIQSKNIRSATTSS